MLLSETLPQPRVSALFCEAWASMEVYGMTLRHLGMQLWRGVKMDHVSLPSPSPTPWDPGVAGAGPLRVGWLIFSSDSSSQA